MTILGHLVAGFLSCSEAGFPGWLREPPIPDPVGFAGMVAGHTGNTLVAAGGARFPGKPPWEGGAKEYSATIWVLGADESKWAKANQTLPTSLAYAVSGSWNGTLIVAGGESRKDASQPITCVERSFGIKADNGRLLMSDFPSLPVPVAYAAGGVIGSRMYVSGGIRSPTSTSALASLWILDLAKPGSGWIQGPPCPGPARILPAYTTDKSGLYLMGGAELYSDPAGKPARRYLRDAWRLDPSGHWHRLPDLPRPVVAAAASPQSDGKMIWVISGDDGSQVGALPTAHKGFPSRSLALDIKENRWLEGPPIPAPRVTLPVVSHANRWWLVSGESRPGVRSSEVWSFDPLQWKLP